MSALAGYNLKQLEPYKGIGVAPNVAVQSNKVLPATATGTIFTVTGAVVVLGLVGVVQTAFAATAVNISVGITGANAALAANPAAAFNATTVGSVIQMPATLGGVLPAAVSAKGSAKGCSEFILENTNVTLTTDATNAGALTWVLLWVPLLRKNPGAVTAP
jgi:hypothetical protein